MRLCRMIAYNLQNLYEKCSKDIEKHAPATVKAQAVKRCRSVRDIDTVITSQIYGVDVDAYYDSQSSISCMPSVAVPMLCLNAGDDPLIDPDLVTMGAKQAKKNDNVISVLTSHGGHLGWVSGWRRQWMCPAISEFLKAANELSINREGNQATECSDKH
jgi:predicted alpha/beta-fold hydrolase